MPEQLSETELNLLQADLDDLSKLRFGGHLEEVVKSAAIALRQVRENLKVVTGARDLARVGEAQFEQERDVASSQAAHDKEELTSCITEYGNAREEMRQERWKWYKTNEILSEQVRELREWTHHHQYCSAALPVQVRPARLGQLPCDCGLDAALAVNKHEEAK